MLSIRLLRHGKLHQPSYKIVVIEKTRPPKSGKFVEQVGFYNPFTKEKGFNADRIKYWISNGAQPSDTMNNLLVKNKIIEGVKIAAHSIKKKKKGETEAPKKPVAEVAKKEEPSVPKAVEIKPEQGVSQPEPEEKQKQDKGEEAKTG
ncbi:30S ribosomal protein S16 [Patescibacteria group bacterium]|nr:30S ribosomal protein S16 [Patescibacteria group bacterium]MBU4162365.1 30S ribosomal protein S16 [Patescibacteria group bacterium]